MQDSWIASAGWSFSKKLVAGRKFGECVWADRLGIVKMYRVGSEALFTLAFSKNLSVDFYLDTKEFEIFWSGNDVDAGAIDFLISDQIIPRLISWGGRLVLHAGAVSMGDRAVMFVAESGRGKSTLCAFLQREGRLIGDDAVVVSEGPSAQAIYNSLRLLPDSLAEFFPGSETKPLAHRPSKQRVHIPSSGHLKPIPIGALFFPAPPSDVIRLQPMHGAETCMSLIENCFALDPTDIKHAAVVMAQASELASSVPAYSLHFPRDYGRLPEVRDVILEALSAA